METTFLNDLSIYNAKASAAIAAAAKICEWDKVNLMSSLKATANDVTLTDEERLNALTALINLGRLLDIPLPPYFPLTTTFADSQTYTGLHNDLVGLNVGDYQHLTAAEKAALLAKPDSSAISFGNLTGSYSDNDSLRNALNGKQNALTGNGFVKANGGTITYDNSIYLTTIDGIEAGGDLYGFYPSPTLSNAAVIGQVLTGFDPNAATGSVSDSSSIISAIQTLNANINDVAAGAGTINEITLALPGSVFDYTPGPFTSGSASLVGTFLSQSQNYIFAGPSGGGAGTPAFRAMVAEDLPTSGASAGLYGSSVAIPQIQVDAYGRIISVSEVSAASGGMVNTVNLAAPGIFTTDSTGTTDVTLTIGLEQQLPNTFWGGPETNIDTTPGFRLLVVADIPQLPLSKIPEITAQLNLKLNDSLNSSLIFMGNGSGKAVQTRVSGDLSASFSVVGSTNTATFTIADAAVTYNKFQNVPNDVGNTTRPILLGRFDLAQGQIQELTLDPTAFVLNDEFGTIGLLTPNPPALVDAGDLLTSTGDNVLVRLPVGASGSLLMPYNSGIDPNPALIWGEVGGDISYTVNTDATPYGEFVIGDNKVTLGKIQQIDNNTLIGNNSGGLGNPMALTAAQATAILNTFSISTTTKGLVPGSNGVGNTYYLDATGNWSEPGGGGGGGTTTFALIMDNSGTGAASGSTFNGSSPITISYNSIGAPKVDGTGASGTWGIDISGNAATVTNGLYSTGSYSKPDWLTSISGGIVSGNISGSAGSVANALTIGAGLSLDSGTTYNGSAAVIVSIDNTVVVTLTDSQTLTNKNLSSGTTIDVGTPGVGTIWYSSDTSGTITPLSASGAGGRYLSINSGTGLPEWATIPYATNAGSISGGLANQILYQNGPGATSFITAPTSTDTFLKWNGSAFAWASAGVGTVTTTGSPSSGQMAKFSGATSITAAISGTDYAPATSGTSILKGNGSGGFSSATAGSDYLAPPSGTALLKANSGGALANAVAGTDYLAPPSGTSILKANSGGALANATAGTDYVAPGSATTSGLTMSTSRLLGRTTASSGAIEEIQLTTTGTSGAATLSGGILNIPQYSGGSGSGTVNSGVQYAVAYYPTAGTTVDDITPPTTNGTYYLTSNVTGGVAVAPTWATLSTTATLTNIGAATATASLTNASSTITWNWNSNTTGNAFAIASSSLSTGYLLNLAITSTANTASRALNIAVSGATASGNTYGAYISNTKTGATSTNTALYLTSSGGTTNYALDVASGISRFAAGTASVPQLILTPSSAAGGTTFTGAVNGSLWYDTNTTTSVSSLSLYKDSLYTKVITKDTNPDFATGASGVVIADSNGNLTKSADLTALGVYSAYASLGPLTGTTANSMISSSIAGSLTIPANFFALGKTLKITVAGVVSIANNDQSTFSIWLGSSIFSATITALPGVTSKPFIMDLNLVCNAVGASATLVVSGSFTIDTGAAQNAHVYMFTPTTTSTFNSASALAFDMKNQWTTGTDSMTVNSNMCYYLN